MGFNVNAQILFNVWKKEKMKMHECMSDAYEGNKQTT